jgi:hypothetical protein
MSMSTGTGRPHPGCLSLIVAILGAGLVVAALLILTRTDGDDERGSDTASPPTSAVATPPAGCTDVTALFRQSAPTDDALARVRQICWQDSGHLRAEIDYPADIEATSPPMRWLCTALTTFITGSERPWNGFTAYSSATVSDGQVLLSRTELDQPCAKPVQS